MKAGIITHYDVHNHGAQLQLYALIQCLKEFGYDAKALRFQKNYDFMGGAEVGKKYNISLRSIPTYIKYLYVNGLMRTLYNIKKRNTLAKFRNQHSIVGDYYSEAKGLDAVVIGSDEIFSIEAGPNPWYYGIGIPCKNQISYAASFGPSTLDMITKHNVGRLVEAGLKNLKSIAVRDQNSADIVEHYLDYKPSIVCDPVLLFGFPKQLVQSEIDKFRRTQKERYCIVYSYDNNMNDDETVNAIKRYAKEKELKVYSIGYFHKWCDKNINLDPLDVFKWFSCADMVFTDTFHGSVISLVSGTQFIAKIRGNANKLQFLLQQFDIEERKVHDFLKIEEIASCPIDYDNVSKKIIDVREQSLNYLKTALGESNVEVKM